MYFCEFLQVQEIMVLLIVLTYGNIVLPGHPTLHHPYTHVHYHRPIQIRHHRNRRWYHPHHIYHQSPSHLLVQGVQGTAELRKEKRQHSRRRSHQGPNVCPHGPTGYQTCKNQAKNKQTKNKTKQTKQIPLYLYNLVVQVPRYAINNGPQIDPGGTSQWILWICNNRVMYQVQNRLSSTMALCES